MKRQQANPSWPLAATLVLTLVAFGLETSGEGFFVSIASAKDNGKGEKGGGNEGGGNGAGSKGAAGSSSGNGKGSGSSSSGKGGGPGKGSGAQAGSSSAAQSGQDAGPARANALMGDKVRSDGLNIEVLHSNGLKEAIVGSRFEMTDSRGRTIVNRPATKADRARLRRTGGS